MALETFADRNFQQSRFRVMGYSDNACEKLGIMPQLIQSREKHEIFTWRTYLILHAHAQHIGEPHMFHGVVYFDYMDGNYRPQFQLGSGTLFGRKATITTFLDLVLEGLSDGRECIVRSFDMLPSLTEGRGNGMKCLISLSNLVGKDIIFSVWGHKIGSQPMTLIISSIGILFHAPTYDVFVNAKQHKKTACVLFMHIRVNTFLFVGEMRRGWCDVGVLRNQLPCSKLLT